MASILPSRPAIVPDLVIARLQAGAANVAFQAPDAADRWQPWTWSAFATRVARIAQALRGRGIARGQRIAILAPTSMEWECVQMAALVLGVSVVGVDVNYPRALRDEVLRFVPIAGIFVHDGETAATIPAEFAATVRTFVTFGPRAAGTPHAAMALDELLAGEQGTATLAALVEAQPGDEALVVFSSGTTGRPKPIAYTHAQVLLAVQSILAAYPDIAEGSRLLCWLPLANLFQRIVDFCGIARGATSYVISDPREVARYLPLANPHLIIGVPRFFERLQAGIVDRVRASRGPFAALATHALMAGARRARGSREAGEQSSARRRSVRLVHRIVARRVRRVFGSSLRFVVSGSAPMPLWLLDWFDGIGVPVYEAYGVSEDIVPVAMNRPGRRRAGTVGQPVPGQEVVLAEDGEIVVRGPGVFRGYLSPAGAPEGGPDARGYWHTGDYGEFDRDGFLRVTGRKSDAFKTGAGKWITPAAIEAILRQPVYVEHAVLLAAGRQFVVALLAIDTALVGRDGKRRSSAATPLGDDAVAAIARSDVASLAAALPRHERPTGLLLTTRRFTLEGGELTANLKLRRRAVEAHYAAALAALLAALEAREQEVGGDRHGPVDTLVVHWA